MCLYEIAAVFLALLYNAGKIKNNFEIECDTTSSANMFVIIL